MKTTILSLLLFLILSSCHKLVLNEEVPICIKEQIEGIQCEEVYNSPAEVWKWEADNKVFYLFTSDCCDQFDYLYDSNCFLVCAPSGGFTGEGDGNCPEFESQVKRTLVWKDDR